MDTNKKVKEINIENNIVHNNYGFSLIEAIVAVAIMAVVFIPLIKNFTTASLINSKAQKHQNVTALAEDIMEEVKSKSIQKLHDESIDNDKMTFSPEDEEGGFTKGKLKKPSTSDPYVITYSDVTVTQGLSYDAKVTIDTSEYSNSNHDGLTDVSNANIRKIPTISNIDSHQHAVLSWEINQYDAKAMENLVLENSSTSLDSTALSNACVSYAANAEKDINIRICEESGMTKITCEVEYRSTSGTKTLKYLVYSGYFDDQSVLEIGGPNVYLFYTLSDKIAASGEAFKTENISIVDETSAKRHSVYFIMQDGENKLSTGSGSKVSISVTNPVGGSTWTKSISYNQASIIDEATVVLSKGTDSESTDDDVVFCSNLLDKNNKTGELYASESKDRIYYVTVDVMEHGKTEVLATLTSTMQTGKEADK